MVSFISFNSKKKKKKKTHNTTMRNASKYKHLKGELAKRDAWYYDITAVTSGDICPLSASGSLIAVGWAATGGGSVALIPHTLTGKRGPTVPPITLVRAHSAQITDVAFSPFSDTVLATASEDTTIKVWNANYNAEGRVVEEASVAEPTAVLRGHKRRVDALRWNPTAEGILASGSMDKSIRVWDVKTQTEKYVHEFPDAVFSLDWNYNGSLLATTTKDKKIRIYEPRADQIVAEGPSHDGVKPSYVVWLGELDRVVTTGFSRMREREYAIWDVRDLSKPLKREVLDSSTGVVTPLYDNDARLVYLGGKGDGNLRVFEVIDTAPFLQPQSTVVSSVAQKGVALVPKRGLDVMEGEVDRVLKLCENEIVPVPFIVPRKSRREFAEDVFPPTAGTVPALSADEWLSGETRRPVLQSLDPARRGATIASSSSSSSSSLGSSASGSTSSSSTTATSSDDAKGKEKASEPESYRRGDIIKEAPKIKAEDDPSNYYVPETIQVVRSSKFRHIMGAPWQQNTWFSNLKVKTMASDAPAIAANATYFAVPWAGGGGQVAVIPLNAPGKMKDNIGTVETGNEVLSIAFHPDHDDLLFTGLDSAMIKSYRVPDGLYQRGKGEPNHGDTESVLKGHKRRIGALYFHPLAHDIMASTSMDLTVKLWDLTTSQEKLSVGDGGEHTDQVQSLAFSYDGAILATSAKDKFLRLWDPRQRQLLNQIASHQSPKQSRLVWLGNSTLVASVGFAKSSERELIIVDTRNASQPLAQEPPSTGPGVFEPFFDEDTNVLSLFAMGDTSVKFFELTSQAPFQHFLTQHQAPTQYLGIAQLPKSSCNVRNVELAQYIKLSGSTVERLAIKVPRTKQEFFQDDIYPPTRVDHSVLSASDWFAGRNEKPKYVSLQPAGMEKLSDAPKQVRQVRKFESIKADVDAADMQKQVVDKFHDKMQSYKEAGEPLVQDLQQGADEDEWSD
eukprot:TRINITY_DN3504_c1_g1_i2.p1 TRINITY_DN3504_c1_g1~~TRINITY_DN3504_c1_g1_i2.p1  ORF type:complete len:959 (+),score=181.75 TRINITY_DN3504_c1_g1_i2:34-2910(+)